MVEQLAQFKGFQDAISREVLAVGSRWKDKIAAGFTNSASRSVDTLAVFQRLAIFAAQRGMYWVNLGLAMGKTSSGSSVQQPPEAGEKRRPTPRTKPSTHSAKALVYLNLSLHP
jgi:hypothetical protein